MKQITGKIVSGCLQIDDASIPTGIEVIIYDYDVDGFPDDELDRHPETGAPCLIQRHSSETSK